MADSKKKPQDTRSADQIKRDIAAARARMSATIEDVVEEFHPATLKKEAVGEAKAFFKKEKEQVVGQVKGDDGWRLDRIGLVGGVVVGGALALVTLRAVVGRLTGATARRKLEKVQLSEAKRTAKRAKAQHKIDSKLARKNAKRGKRNAKEVGSLSTDDSSISSLAEAMLRQAAVLRSQAEEERKQGMVRPSLLSKLRSR